MAEDFDLEILRGRLHVHQFGSLPAIPAFCIPGLSSNSRVFEALGEYRQERGAGIVAFDLRGRGWSEISPPGTYGWEHHARDLFEAADAMNVDHFDLIGHSMGAFVALTAASIDRDHRIRRVVLIDGLGFPTQTAVTAIVAALARLKDSFSSRDAYVDAIRAGGMVTPWNHYWEAHYRYDLIETDAGIRPRTSSEAVMEDAAYGGTHDPRALWPMMTVPSLVVRGTIPLGGPDGFVLTRQDYDAFLRATPSAKGVEVEANHYAVAMDPKTLEAVHAFIGSH